MLIKTRDLRLGDKVMCHHYSNAPAAFTTMVVVAVQTTKSGDDTKGFTLIRPYAWLDLNSPTEGRPAFSFETLYFDVNDPMTFVRV